jgi:hypothetical protein
VEVVTGFGQGEVCYRCLCLRALAPWFTRLCINQTTTNAYNVEVYMFIERMCIHECLQWASPYSVPGPHVVFSQSAVGKQLCTTRLLPPLPLASAVAYSSLNVATEVGYPIGAVDVSLSRKG